MRIMFFLSDLDGGGAQRTIVNLVNAMTGIDQIEPILVVARADGAASTWLRPEVNVVQLGTERLRFSALSLRRTIKRYEPDVVLSTMADANVVTVLATVGLARRPTIVLRETNSHRARGDMGVLRRKLIGWAYRKASAVVALSKGVGDELIDDYALMKRDVHVIHNPVDIELFQQTDHNEKPISLPFDGPGPVFLSMGRLCEQKGFDVLIQAFGNLHHSSAKLVILGEGPDRTKLEGLVSKLKMSDRVTLPGYQKDIKPWLAAADGFILSSRWEGFGHVIVEAMAGGLPVIATDCPHGPRDIITPNHDGMLVAPNDPDALSHAIESLLNDTELADKLRLNALESCTRFAAHAITETYLHLFDRYAGQGKIPSSETGPN